jgi:hypothetical protein
MKQKAIYFALLILSVGLLSCSSDDPINTITFTNSADANVSVNFRGTVNEVPVGATVELTNILQGEYEYETIFILPAGTNTYDAGEELAGTFLLNAGTKILVIYVSVIQDSNYSISASITTSDNLLENGILPNPIGP